MGDKSNKCVCFEFTPIDKLRQIGNAAVSIKAFSESLVLKFDIDKFQVYISSHVRDS